mmetsp:Transcript_13178/g.19888  ORF Transcript_13178/g.19888 Transcript_13178/m.19888 type:complete len:212 (-) Transcript_13178:288-923(-)|eukprot:CAMPEP_0172583436 /NCGR_PEP_ID=MMETSP1068-20121228/3075_1 /TAXON_ID=35684 /ORGANISM="Pseudopedinella elastica, Strain CCMP716" /LENGTH=211 /DNA_ID=CAMNT_0013377241 /DNA_START=39 /DNA_END=674 /DNA_ORIENTATION=-
MAPLRAVLASALLGSAQCFVPNAAPRALRTPVRMASDSDIVPVNEDSIKASVAITGALAGLTIGGPVTAALGAALANYVATKDSDFNAPANSVGKTILLMWNLLLKANADLGVTDKAGASIKESVTNAKAGSSGETVEQIEGALESVLAKSKELNEEYKLVDAFTEILGKAGDLSVEAIDALIKFAEENDVVAKASNAAKDLAEKGKSAAK